MPTTVPNSSSDLGGSDASDHRDRPAQGGHTAVAIGNDEEELARLKIRANRTQVEKLLTWAMPFPSRTWAIEGAEGLGFLVAQQLVTAGETVVDVPATLAARTRVLGTGRSNKNDPSDAFVGCGDSVEDT